MRKRANLVFIGFTLAFLAVAGRLFYWQIIRGKELAKNAESQYESEKLINAPRGNILGNDNTWLVSRGEAWLIYALLPEIKKTPKDIANLLAPLFVDEVENKEGLKKETESLSELLSKKGSVWVLLKQKVSPEVKRKIEALGISGIGFEPQEVRVYPEATRAAQLLGFVGKEESGEDKGYFGLEGYYDLPLSARTGYLSKVKDAQGRSIFLGDRKEVRAVGGVDLITHIDKTIQRILEEKLLTGMEKYGASASSGIVMDPTTGAVLAMASYPSYDPATYWQFSDEYFKNPNVSSSFEPGSIFKVLVMAAALDAGVVEPETKCDKCSGPLKVDKYLIETWNRKYNPDSTIVDVIVNSDNVGMVFVGQKLGADKLYDYLDKFGIGRHTGIDLQGEISGKLRQKGSWNIVDLATASFGQGVALTPIQMIKAVAAIANGGELFTPQVVDRIQGDTWSQDVKAKNEGRVISKDTSEKLKYMMLEAAKKGEAKWTHLRGFKVAGKTGTAQIPIAGHYDTEKTIASFIGFAPSERPKFIMLITLLEPQSSPWASETAAPLWYAVAKELFPYLGIQPEN